MQLCILCIPTRHVQAYILKSCRLLLSDTLSTSCLFLTSFQNLSNFCDQYYDVYNHYCNYTKEYDHCFNPSIVCAICLAHCRHIHFRSLRNSISNWSILSRPVRQNIQIGCGSFSTNSIFILWPSFLIGCYSVLQGSLLISQFACILPYLFLH